MKIYISCNGLGLGHVGRMLSVANVFRMRGDTVIFGSWGPGVEFSKKMGFGGYKLSAADWSDKEDGSFDLWGTLIRAPMIIFCMLKIISEERGILKKEKPDAIISDGAVGHLSGKLMGIPSLYLDHQMDFPVKNSIIRGIIKRTHDIIANVGKKIAVVDFETPDNIYPYSITKINGAAYTGPLVSVFPDDYDSQKDIKKKLKIENKLCLIMISGPKNSPYALEKKILEIEPELMKMKDWTFIIKVPGRHDDKQNIRYLTWIDDVYELLKACDMVVSRGGFTTVCDIVAFAKKSILIPQPRQVEQEALAKNLKEKRISETINQDEVDKLHLLINEADRTIDMCELRKISDEISKSNAKQKVVDIIDDISKKAG